MKHYCRLQHFVIATFLSVSIISVASAEIVRFTTSVGDFDVRLYGDIVPNTVANFLNYVNDGDYTNSIVHRSIPDFVIQGGAYYSNFSTVPVD